MSLAYRLALVSSGIVIGIALSALWTGADFLPVRCSHDVVREAPSTGPAVAVVYVTNCGATTRFVTSVTTWSKEARFDADRADAFFRIEGQGGVDAVWPEGRILNGTTPIRMIYPPGASIIRRADRWHGLDIEYEER